MKVIASPMIVSYFKSFFKIFDPKYIEQIDKTFKKNNSDSENEYMFEVNMKEEDLKNVKEKLEKLFEKDKKYYEGLEMFYQAILSDI